MIKREIQKIMSGIPKLDNTTTPNYLTISGNYFPVDTAIVMRDLSNNSNLQVTVVTDRPQGGSVDLSTPATIELMQNRRLL